MIIGYDPRRVALLRFEVSTAIRALETIRSEDPAAADAITSVADVRRVLIDAMLPAVVAIEQDDPLVRVARSSVPTGADAYERSTHSTRSTRRRCVWTAWSHLPTFDLLMHVQFELTRQVEEHGAPDLDDPFWTEEFPGLVEEFSQRATIDDRFGEQMIHHAATNPLIGSIVAAGDFGTEVVVGVTNALITAPTLGFARDTYRRAPILDLVADLVTDPDAALDLLMIDGTAEAIFTWNRDELHPMEIPERLLAELASVALDLPFESGRRIDDAYLALAQFVELADTRHFDAGFSATVSRALTESVVTYLPLLLDSFGNGDTFYGKNFQNDRTVELGAHGDVIDFFGGLLRDPASFELLVAAIPLLSVTAGHGGHDIQDVTDYADALATGAVNEQIEEHEQAQRERDRWNLSVDIVSDILDRSFEAAGPAYESSRLALGWVEGGTHWLVDRIDADDAGLDHVGDIAHLLLMVGLAASLVADRTDEADDETPVDDDVRDVRDVRDDLDDIRDAMEQGTTAEELRPKILDLRESVERYAGLGVFDDIDRVRPVPIDMAADTEPSS